MGNGTGLRSPLRAITKANISYHYVHFIRSSPHIGWLNFILLLVLVVESLQLLQILLVDDLLGFLEHSGVYLV